MATLDEYYLRRVTLPVQRGVPVLAVLERDVEHVGRGTLAPRLRRLAHVHCSLQQKWCGSLGEHCDCIKLTAATVVPLKRTEFPLQCIIELSFHT